MPKVRIRWAKVKTAKIDKVPGAKKSAIREKGTLLPRKVRVYFANRYQRRVGLFGIT
jgi:hypothetical protein